MAIEPGNLIQINLMPPERMPRRENLWLKAGALLGMLIISAAAVGAFVILSTLVLARESDARKFKKEIELMAEASAQYDEFKALEDTLKKKQEIIDDLILKRFVWAPKLNSISDLLPQDVWLEEITTRAQQYTVEKDVPIGGGKTRKERKTLYNLYLVVDAATSKIEEEMQMAKQAELMGNLQSNTRFMADLEQINWESGGRQFFTEKSFGSLSKELKDYFDVVQPRVWRFKLECKIKSREGAGEKTEAKS